MVTLAIVGHLREKPGSQQQQRRCPVSASTQDLSSTHSTENCSLRRETTNDFFPGAQFRLRSWQNLVALALRAN